MWKGAIAILRATKGSAFAGDVRHKFATLNGLYLLAIARFGPIWCDWSAVDG
jgi:hypothetical protein